MSEIYYKAIYEGRQVLIVCKPDTDVPDSPLAWTDPVANHRPLFVLTNHSNYRFGDKDAERLAWNFLRAADKWDDSWLDEDIWIEGTRAEGGHWESNPDYIDTDDGLEAIVKASDRVGAYVMPVYMYEHSDIAISLSPFHDSWDSGTLGILLWTREQVALHNQVAINPGGMPDKMDVYKMMENYFSDYKKYVEGEVYDLMIYDIDDELEYLGKSKRAARELPLTLDDMAPHELEFLARQGDVLESCGGFYFGDGYGPVEAATEHFNVEDMEEL